MAAFTSSRKKGRRREEASKPSDKIKAGLCLGAFPYVRGARGWFPTAPVTRGMQEHKAGPCQGGEKDPDGAGNMRGLAPAPPGNEGAAPELP